MSINWIKPAQWQNNCADPVAATEQWDQSIRLNKQAAVAACLYGVN